MSKKFKWTVVFEVDESWVADGFDLDDERALEMLSGDLSWADDEELGAKVIKAPRPEAIMRARGYTEKQIELAQRELMK